MNRLITIIIFNLALSQVFNTSTGTEHPDLAQAVYFANSGDTIQATPGNYTGSLYINKAINLEGSPGSIIDATNQHFGVLIASNDVTFSGFEIIGNDLTVSGVTVNPGCQNITIDNNVIHGMGLANPSNESPLSYGILAWGNEEIPNPPINVTISNNEIYDVTGAGISLGEVTVNFSILDNYIHNINAVVLPENIIPGTDFTSIGITALTSQNLLVNGNTFENLTVANSYGFSSGSISNNTYIQTQVLFSSIYFSTDTSDLFSFEESNDFWIASRNIQSIFTMKTYCSSLDTAQLTAESGSTIFTSDTPPLEITQDCDNQWGGTNFGVCSTCLTSLLGDSNQDGFVDILDVVMIVNSIVNQTNLSEVEMCLSDLDENGVLNVIDVVNIIYIISTD